MLHTFEEEEKHMSYLQDDGQDLGRKKRKKLGYFKPEPLCAGTTTASRSSWGRNKGECLDTVRFRSWVRLGRLVGGGREEKHL